MALRIRQGGHSQLRIHECTAVAAGRHAFDKFLESSKKVCGIARSGISPITVVAFSLGWCNVDAAKLSAHDGRPRDMMSPCIGAINRRHE